MKTLLLIATLIVSSLASADCKIYSDDTASEAMTHAIETQLSNVTTTSNSLLADVGIRLMISANNRPNVFGQSVIENRCSFEVFHNGLMVGSTVEEICNMEMYVAETSNDPDIIDTIDSVKNLVQQACQNL